MNPPFAVNQHFSFSICKENTVVILLQNSHWGKLPQIHVSTTFYCVKCIVRVHGKLGVIASYVTDKHTV